MPVKNNVEFCFQSGDLMDEDKVLTWLSKQVTSDEIEEVTNEIMDMLIKLSSKLAVIFCE